RKATWNGGLSPVATAVSLEGEPQRELNLPRVLGCAVDLTGPTHNAGRRRSARRHDVRNQRARAIKNTERRDPEVGVVKQVEEFSTKLELCLLPKSRKRSVLDKGPVEVRDTRSGQRIAPQVALIVADEAVRLRESGRGQAGAGERELVVVVVVIRITRVYRIVVPTGN